MDTRIFLNQFITFYLFFKSSGRGYCMITVCGIVISLLIVDLSTRLVTMALRCRQFRLIVVLSLHILEPQSTHLWHYDLLWFAAYHIISYRIVSYHIISYHIFTYVINYDVSALQAFHGITSRLTTSFTSILLALPRAQRAKSPSSSANDAPARLSASSQAVGIQRRECRAWQGCPWDSEETHQQMVAFLK